MEVTYFTEYHEMPSEATFDELLSWSGFANYAEMGVTFQILFVNGVYYTGHEGDETMKKCGRLAVCDKNCL